MPLQKNTNKSELENRPDSRRLMKSLFTQKSNGFLCDVQLQLKGSFISCHACVLASCSSYFMKCFEPSYNEDNSKENHWCSKKPLVISLNKVISSVEDLCLICISKIIDFMYLRELVIVQGHFQHFSKIVYCLQVLDLLPLCKKYDVGKKCSLPINVGSHIDKIKSSSKIESYDTITKVNASSGTTTIGKNKVKDTEQLINQQHLVESEIHELASNKSYYNRKSTNEIIENLNKNQAKCNIDIPKLSVPSNYQDSNKVEVSINHNSDQIKENTSKNQKCDFLCCTDNSSSEKTKPRKKRKITCDMCVYSSISVQKMLKHVESTNHFKTICPICKWNIQKSDDVRQHLKEHDNLKPYICFICKKRNRHWEYHRLHLRVHCKNKQFHCGICQKSFKRHNNLTAHLLTHDKNCFCTKCGYITSDSKAFKIHLLEHSEENKSSDSVIESSHDCTEAAFNAGTKMHEIEKRFYCQVCSEGFTLKKNLTRHTQLKHFSTVDYKCTLCTYTTKRTDLLKNHMKKRHNYVSVKMEAKKDNGKSKISKIVEELHQDSNNIVGVLIPVQLMSTSDSTSKLNAFAIKPSGKQIFQHEENIQGIAYENHQSQNNTSKINVEACQTSIFNMSEKNDFDNISPDIDKNENNLLRNPFNLNTLTNASQGKMLWDTKLNTLHSLPSNDATHLKLDRQSCQNEINSLPDNLSSDMSSFDTSDRAIEPVNSILQEMCLVVDEENSNTIEHSKDISNYSGRNEDIWLNEATGELLSGKKYVNVHVIDTGCRVEESNHGVPAKMNTSIDFNDSFQTYILNDSANRLPVFDLGDETDDIPSNPQTPQTNLVEFDDPNSLFSWNRLDTSFCSTWVLNETTGELNMVSFNVQPIKNSDELKLDENNGMLSSIEDDDDTALFLNEGTGDLSVIYFNTNKRECVSPKPLFNEQINQEALETLSEHSNDDDDLIHEEFLKASASFMANSENETFLNELTGEFHNTNLNNYQSETKESEVTGDKAIYLNEETGEISWNILDQNVKSDLVDNVASLIHDFDDSLNCEDLKHFSSEMDDFSSQFFLGSNTSNNWHTVDETCNTLLNECTGEFMTRD